MKSLFLVAVLFSLNTLAAQPKLFFDNGQMLRCVSFDKGNEHDGVLFFWDNDQYAREIQFIRIKDIPQSANDTFPRECNAWGFLAVEATGFGHPLPKDLSGIYGYQFSEKDKAGFEQVRAGGNVYREEQTPEEFLASHPIPNFDRQLNRSLTNKYGVGFVSSLYKYLVTSKPENQKFAESVHKNLSLPENQNFVHDQFQDFHFLVVKGFMQSPKNDRVKPLVDLLKSQNLKVDVLETDTIGGIESNSKMVEKQITQHLDRGEKIILFAGSKGGPEAMAALSRLSSRIENPDSKGRVVAYLGLSGMMDGSFLLDWALKFPTDFYLKHEMAKESKKLGITMDTFEGLTDMGTKFLNPYVRAFETHLPQNITYFNVVGVPGGNGFVKDKNISTLQQQVSRPLIHGAGANDGYIEFPGTEIPQKDVKKLFEVVFESSHVVMDGTFEGYDLTQEQSFGMVMNALFSSIAQFVNP